MAAAASPYLPFYTSSPSKPGEGFLFSRLNYCTDKVLNFDVGTLKPPKSLLRDFEPNIVIGTGGHVSFPICLAAVLKRTKLVIHEQNSVPGFAICLSFADLVFVAFNSTVDCCPRKNRCFVCGNPVRLATTGKVSKVVARSSFFPWTEKMSSEEVKVMLVLGGSFGASAINIAFLNLYQQMLLNHRNWFIIWQTGLEAFNEMESLVGSHPQLLLTPFLHTMNLAYAAADLAISRAGAMTCSEILATGKPSILVDLRPQCPSIWFSVVRDKATYCVASLCVLTPLLS